MPNNENKMNDQIDRSVVQEVSHPIGDLHICGACKAQFHDIDIFILHKRHTCIGNHSHNQGPSGNYGNTHSNTQAHSHHQKHNNNLYTNNNNNDDQAMMDQGGQVEAQVEEEDVQDHGAEVSLTTSGACPSSTEEVVFIEVPQDGGGQISQQGVDGASGIVSLQNALMSNQSGEVTIINQTGGLEGTDSAVQVVQQLLRSPPVTSHSSLDEYNNSHSLLQVLQGTEVSSANSQELQLDGSHTDVISKGLKKVTLNKKFRCEQEDCGYTTAYQKDLERHRRIHTGERPFACHLCDKSFNRADKLKVHIRGHAGNKPYSCCHCNYATSDSSSLKKHLRIHSDERPFKCQICQYASRNSSQLIVHLRTHTGDSPFQCQLCSAKFKINSDLKRHVRLHTGEKPYRCEHCDYRCAIKGNLRTHYKINHSSDRVLVCDQCDFTTSSPRALREHAKSHDTYELTYRCPICKYTCASRTTLKVHLRVHSNDRPYKCRFCSFSSKQSGNVGTHMRRKHMDMLWSSAGKIVKRENERGNAKDKKSANRLRPVVKKPFKCSKCDASFVRQDSLRSHVRHHKEVERDLAQKLENTVQAVLQLSTPVNLDPKRVRPEDQQSSNEQHQVPEVHVASIEDLVVEEVVAAPVVTVTTEETSKQNNTPTVTTASTTPAPVRRSPAARPPSHSYNQVISNRLAFAQNNQNLAIEENFQNNVINNRRLAAAAAAAASAADKPSVSTASTITSASQSNLMKRPTAVATTNMITNNGTVPVPVSQARLIRVVGPGQQKLTPIVYQTVSKSSRVLPSANRPVVARTVRPQAAQLVQAVKHKQEHQQPHQQQLTVATATHQQSSPSQQHNTVTTSHPLLQQQLTTANSQQIVKHQVSTQEPKPVQVTFQVPQSMAQIVSPLTSSSVTRSMQVMAPPVRPQQVLSTSSLVSIQQQEQQQQHQHQQQQQQQIVQGAGAPVSFQFVQNVSAGSSLLPQQVQVLLPASAFTHASTTGVQVAQPGQYQQQVILQVPAGAEGLLDSSGQFQIPVPLRLLPHQQSQIIQPFQAPQQQQQQQPQQQLTQPQVITLQPGSVQQQHQQPVEMQQVQQQQQVLQQQQQQVQIQTQIQHQTNNDYSHKK